MKESRLETYPHILEVQKYLNIVIKELIDRGNVHDQSKLVSPEVEGFNSAPPLDKIDYNSESYKESLSNLKDTLDHHYAKNDHHPEHHNKVKNENLDEDLDYLIKQLEYIKDQDAVSYLTDIVEIYRSIKSSSLNNMDLIQVTEMFCDWKASTKRHNKGNILESIDINKEKYKFGDLLANIFINTAERYFNE